MTTPHPGDTLIDRYELIEALRQEPGLAVWRVNDHVLARECQLFIITNPSAAVTANAVASALVLSKDVRFTPVLQMHSVDDVSVLVTGLDEGVSLSDYLEGPSRDTLSIDAMRVILGETALALKTLLSQGLNDRAITTDVIRLSPDHIRIADAPVSKTLRGPLTQTNIAHDTDETLAVRQLAGVLYAMLTRTPYSAGQRYDKDRIVAVANKPHEFWIICQRGLGFATSSGDPAMPIRTLDEFIALLGYWKPMAGLTDGDIIWPEAAGPASIQRTQIRAVDPEELLELPEFLIADAKSKDDKASHADGSNGNQLPDWDANQLLFPGPSEVEMVKPANGNGSNLLAALHDAPIPVAVPHPTVPVNVLQIRNLSTGGSSGQRSDHTPVAPETASAAHDEAESLADQPSSVTSNTLHTTGMTEANEEPLNSESYRQGDDSRIAGIQPDARVQSTLARQESQPSVLHVDVAPPSFAPQEPNDPDAQLSDEVSSYRDPVEAVDHEESTLLNSSNSVLFGKFTTRTITITLGSIFLVVALVLAMTNLLDIHKGFGFTDSSASQWPTDMSNVRFPGAQTNASSSSSSSPASTSSGAASDAATSSAASTSPDSSTASSPTKTVDHTDREVGSVPTPQQIIRNTTAYQIAKQTFLNHPNKLDGYGWYVHLKDPQNVWKIDFQIRQTSGSGMVYVNSTQQNPNNGEPVGTFQIDGEGKASVELTQPVNTQDIVVWFPTQQMPQEKRLSFNGISVY